MAAQSDKTRCATGTFTRTAPTLQSGIAILHLRSNVQPLGGASCDSVLYSVFLLVLLCAVQDVKIRSISPGQQWPGFSFALHLLMVQGFCFALLQYSHIQAFTARFVPSMQLYHQHSKAAHRALHWLFQLFAVFCRRCVSGASGYTALPVPRWSVSQRRSISSAYQIPATRWTLYRPAQPPYYNKVYKGAAVCLCYRSMPDDATHRRPCQPGGVLMFPTPGISLALA